MPLAKSAIVQQPVAQLPWGHHTILLNKLDAPEERLWYSNADVEFRVEIQANFPNGAQDQTKRAVSENAKTLGFKNADWE